MTLPGPAALGLVLLVSELGLRLGRQAAPGGTRAADRSSLTLLWVTILLALGGAVLVARALPAWDFPLPVAGHLAALALFAAGLALRWWAILTLGRFFTVDVAIHHDHELVTRGPYRLARHPSYTGLLLLFVALTILYGNGAALVVALLPILLALLYRIRVEEEALSAAFGPAYAKYRRTTKALLPGLL